MSLSQYPDGFPKTALEAVNFSYFLTEDEKKEWREWLQDATEEQKDELIDILHSMWQDNQKTAVPNNFAQTGQSQPTPPAQSSQPNPFVAQNNNTFANPFPQDQFNPNPFPGQNFTTQNQNAQATNPFNQTNSLPNPFDPANQAIPSNTDQSYNNFNSNFSNQQPQNPFATQQSQAQPAQQVQPVQTNPFATQNNNPFATQNNNTFSNPQPQDQLNPNPFPGQNFVNQNQNAPIPVYSQPNNPFADNNLNSAQPTTFPNFNAQNTQIPPNPFETTQLTANQSQRSAPATTNFVDTPQVQANNVSNSGSNSFSLDDSFGLENVSAPIPEAPKIQEPVATVPEKSVQTSKQPEISQPKEVEKMPESPAPSFIDFDFDDDFEESQEIEKTEVKDTTEKSKKQPKISYNNLVENAQYTPNPILDGVPTTSFEDFEVEKKSKAPTKVEHKVANEVDLGEDEEYQYQEKEDYSDDLEDDYIKPISIDSAGKTKEKTQSKPKPATQRNNQALKLGSVSKPNENTIEKSFVDFVDSSSETREKQLEYLKKITEVILNYSDITSFLEDTTQKVVRINDQLIEQAKAIKSIQAVTSTSGTDSLQEQIDNLLFEMSSLQKDYRSLKVEVRRKQKEVNETIASVGADTYTDGGAAQKIELMKIDMIKLQQEVQKLKNDKQKDQANQDFQEYKEFEQLSKQV